MADEEHKKAETIYMAKLSEQSDRYEEMAAIMKEFVEKNPNSPLNKEERNLLSVAYKNVVGQRRSSWRVICSIEEKTKDSKNIHITKNYKAKVEAELKDLCREVLDVLNKLIAAIADADDATETKVFYYKLKGDYYRYLAEVSHGDEDRDDGQRAYQQGRDVAEKELGASDPIFLGLLLNFSVFYKEIVGDTDAAIDTAQKALDNARLAEDDNKDSELIMQLLRDNLSLWKDELEEDDVQQA